MKAPSEGISFLKSELCNNAIASLTSQAELDININLKNVSKNETLVLSIDENCDNGTVMPVDEKVIYTIPDSIYNSTFTLYAQLKKDTSISACVKLLDVTHDNTPPQSPSLQVNAGEQTTNSTEITLTPSATGATYMYITNTAECASDGAWEAYAATKAWTVSLNNSIATVYAKFKDDAGNESNCVNASINFEASTATSSSTQTISAGQAPTGNAIAVQNTPAVMRSNTFSLTLASTGASQMYITNTSGCQAGGNWAPFSNLTNWTLPASTAGTYSIYAKFEDEYHNTSDCVNTSIPFVPWDIVSYIKASNSRTGAYFGYTASMSGDGLTLAVGSIYEKSNATGINGSQSDVSLTSAGAVYVFTRASVQQPWTQTTYIKPGVIRTGDGFGYSVALSSDGTVLAVGSAYEDGNTTGVNGSASSVTAGMNSGAVYVFKNTSGTWSQQAYIKTSNPGSADSFGFTVALSSDGSTLVASAPWEDSNATGIGGDQSNNGATDSGAAYVFTQTNGTWSQQAYIKASNSRGSSNFGYFGLALSADGSTMAISSYRESSAASGINGDQTDTSASRAGAVYLFIRSGSTWTQQAYIKSSNPHANDSFGGSLALSNDGNVMAVSASGESSGATGIGGNPADISVSSAGATYIFTRSGSTWSQQTYIKASNTATNNWFGATTALSGDGTTLAVAATGESSASTGRDGSQTNSGASGSGAVYMFKWNGSNWSQQAYLKASNSYSGLYFGGTISMDYFATSLVIGTSNESSSATGIGGVQAHSGATNSGAIYAY